MQASYRTLGLNDAQRAPGQKMEVRVVAGAASVTKAQILVADDDEELSREIADFVERYEFVCVTAASWTETLAMIQRQCPDAIILDQWLGEIDAVARLSELRRLCDVPVLILTSNQESADRILGLELGADDFLNKPIAGRELVARLRAQLRRVRSTSAGPQGWSLDDRAHRLVHAAGRSIRLTSAEFTMLRLLAGTPGKIYSRDDLCRSVFRRPWQPSDRAIDTIVANLRSKLDRATGRDSDAEPSCITTVRPLGYKFVKFPD